MEPEEGRHQTVTKVNVLSHENFNIREADLVHVWGKLQYVLRYDEEYILLSGSKATV